MWSIGVEGFCFLLLCQVPSQRLLISVNLSCATTFSFPLALSLSPISLTFPLSLPTSSSLCLLPPTTPHHIPQLTYSHCTHCWIPFFLRGTAADHSAASIFFFSFFGPSASNSGVPRASHGSRGSVALARRACLDAASTPTTNRCAFPALLMTMRREKNILKIKEKKRNGRGCKVRYRL